MENSIVPALIIDDHPYISAEEFHKQFCVWLEEKGVLSELRSYFRTNMIEILKNTAVGYSVTNKTRQPISPKMHAMNLLISEYMLYSQHHFSLCVFCAEVSLKHVFSKTNLNANSETNWKFLQSDVYDILESVGVLRNSECATNISSEYYGGNDTLLACLLRFNVTTSFDLIDAPIDVEFDENYDFVMKNVENLLSRTVSSGHISKIKRYIKCVYDKERENTRKVKQEERHECKKVLNKYRGKLDGLSRYFDEERAKLEGEISDLKLIVEKKLDEDRDKAACSKLHEIKIKNDTLIALTNQLHEENDNLKQLNRNYVDQIEELGHRAVLLMNELDNSQQRIAQLSGLIENSEASTSKRSVSFAGAGEQSCQQAVPMYRQKNFRNLTRERRKRNFDKSTPSTSSDGSEVTDYVLKEAKDKLRSLELESNRIDERCVNGVEAIAKCSLRSLAETLEEKVSIVNNSEPDFHYFDVNRSTHLPNANRTTRHTIEDNPKIENCSEKHFSANTFSFLDYFKANGSDVNLKLPKKTTSEYLSNLDTTRASETTTLDID